MSENKKIYVVLVELDDDQVVPLASFSAKEMAEKYVAVQEALDKKSGQNAFVVSYRIEETDFDRDFEEESKEAGKCLNPNYIDLDLDRIIRFATALEALDFEIFENVPIHNWSKYEQFAYLGLACYMLGMETEDGDAEFKKKAISVASEITQGLYCEEFENLRTAAIIKRAMWDNAENRETEFMWQDRFKAVAGDVVCGATVVDHKDNIHHRPDAWLDIGGELVPVEAKLRKFDQKALEQLTRYMTVYKCDHGVAVAKELTVELPDNIRFVSFDQITEAENKRKEDAENVE